MFDPVKLRVLRSVVETGSVRASAQALGYTPSAVSQHLAGLRREAGVEIVERVGRGIEVTPAGRTIAAEAEGVLDALDRLDRVAADLRAGRSGALTFTYVTSVALTWGPTIARELSERFPDLGLLLTLRQCSAGAPTATGGDVVVIDSQTPDFGPGWRTIDVLEEGFVAIVARDHPLAERTAVRLRDLADQPWATDDALDSVWFATIASACRAAGITPRVAMNPPDFPTLLGLIAGGGYVTVQPSLIGQGIRPDLVALPILDDQPRRRLQVRIRERVIDHPGARFIVERVRHHAALTAQTVPGVRAL